MGTAGGLSRKGRSDVPLTQPSKPYRAPFPLLPDHGPQPAPDPMIQPFQHRGRLAVAEIALPSTQVAGEFFRHLFQTDALGPLRQFPHSLLTPEQSLGCNAPFRF